MSNTKDNNQHFHELDYRLQRVKSQILLARSAYELALINQKPKDTLEDLVSDLDNLKRKLNWFSGAIKPYMNQKIPHV